ncbi:hypothetical protein AGMMS50229_06860 [Campylobacterota bacterium]|nr:hypothetical protein AGMMS50229_06860 [Campylobacterota bacterium]
MRWFLSLLIAAMFASSCVAAIEEGDVDVGQRIYLKSLSDSIGINGADFAKRHTAEEWSALLDGEGERFAAETIATYPATKDFLSSRAFVKQIAHIKALLVLYAKDSAAFPICN